MTNTVDFLPLENSWVVCSEYYEYDTDSAYGPVSYTGIVDYGRCKSHTKIMYPFHSNDIRYSSSYIIIIRFHTDTLYTVSSLLLSSLISHLSSLTFTYLGPTDRTTSYAAQWAPSSSQLWILYSPRSAPGGLTPYSH